MGQYLGLLAVDTEELGVKGVELVLLHPASPLWHVGMHDVLPLPFICITNPTKLRIEMTVLGMLQDQLITLYLLSISV